MEERVEECGEAKGAKIWGAGKVVVLGCDTVFLLGLDSST
jgi:hypothetical protein